MRFAEFRKKQNLTQNQVANALNMAPTTYAGYEQKRVEPSISTLKKLSKLYNCSIDELVGVETTASKRNEATEFQNELLDLIMQLDETQIEKVKIYVNGMLGNLIKLRG